jgi:zinc-ribbon family
MIIYGTKAKEIGKEIISEKCTNCGSILKIDMHVFQKYAHVFWIPFFPIGKTGVSQCDHCKQVLKLKEMPPSIKTSYDNLKAQSKTPVWMFSGLALIALIIISGTISSKNNDKKNAKLILAPHKGDIFEIKTKENQYTIYKVDEVASDSVFIVVNAFETNLQTGIADIKKKGDSSFIYDAFGFSKKELKKMLEDGEILNIDRK